MGAGLMEGRSVESGRSCGDQKTSTLLVAADVRVLINCVVSCSQVSDL